MRLFEGRNVWVVLARCRFINRRWAKEGDREWRGNVRNAVGARTCTGTDATGDTVAWKEAVTLWCSVIFARDADRRGA